MEKRIFENVMKFLQSYDVKIINFEWSSYGGDGFNDIEWEYGWSNLGNRNLPTSINNLVIEIVSEYAETMFENVYSDLESYKLRATFLPFEKKVELYIDVEENQNDYREVQGNLGENSEVVAIMKQNEYEEIEFRYNGGGDSGELESVKVNSIDDQIYNWERDNDKSVIYQKAYDLLENAFSGWEIDDGSSGTIYMFANGSYVIEHEWYTREFVDSGEQKIITSKDFE